MFFANIMAGISLIAFQSPLFQGLWQARDPGLSKEILAGYRRDAHRRQLAGTTASGGCSGAGCPTASAACPTFPHPAGKPDLRLCRAGVCHQPGVFGGLVCYVLLCYGGGFGTMPSCVLDTFGPRQDARRVRRGAHCLVGRGDRRPAVGRLSDRSSRRQARLVWGQCGHSRAGIHSGRSRGGQRLVHRNPALAFEARLAQAGSKLPASLARWAFIRPDWQRIIRLRAEIRGPGRYGRRYRTRGRRR